MFLMETDGKDGEAGADMRACSDILIIIGLEPPLLLSHELDEHFFRTSTSREIRFSLTGRTSYHTSPF